MLLLGLITVAPSAVLLLLFFGVPFAWRWLSGAPMTSSVVHKPKYTRCVISMSRIVLTCVIAELVLAPTVTLIVIIALPAIVVTIRGARCVANHRDIEMRKVVLHALCVRQAVSTAAEKTSNPRRVKCEVG